MSKYILRPSYNDMSTKVLGSSLKTIKKAFKKHWEEQLYDPEGYDVDYILKIKNFLNKEHKNIEELIKDYNNSDFDEDYNLEESY